MILITGAGGFIGSSLVTRLAEQGFDVTGLLRSEIFRKEADHIFLDLTSDEHLKLLKNLDIQPDTLIHLAGHIQIALKPDKNDASRPPLAGDEDLPALYRSNLLSTVNLIEYCKHAGVKHMIFASSQAVYGLPSMERVTEETPCKPLEHYALSKACCERALCLAASDSMAVTVYRFPGVYSEKRESGTVFRFCRSATKTKTIRVTADLPLPFDVIHIDDVLDAFLCAVTSKPQGFEIYNIATGEPNSLNLLADRIAGLVEGCRVEHAVCPQPVICMDPEKAYRRFGWRATPSTVRLRQVLDAADHD